MTRLLFVFVIIIIIFLVLKSRSNSKSIFSNNFYKRLIVGIIVFGIIFFLATSGKILIPQLLNIIKVGLPFLTKFIGI